MTAILMTLGLLFPAEQAVDLSRVFTAGEKAQYEVKSNLQVETRQHGLNTWIPEEQDISYKFTWEVLKMRPGGIAEVRYKRPTMTVVLGETFDRPPQTKVENVNLNALLGVSSINEIVSVKEEKDDPAKAPTKPPAKGGKGGGGGGGLLPALHFSASGPVARTATAQMGLQEFIGEVYRLALFIGSMDSSLDFSPKLPFDEVQPGEVWKRTVGYSPQKLKGGDGKVAVQRLDYAYKYEGTDTYNGKPAYKVSGTLVLDTDLAEFFHQIYNVKPADTGLKEIRLKLEAKIVFLLDAKTRSTISATADATGSMAVWITQVDDRPVEEQRIKGHTTLKRLS